MPDNLEPDDENNDTKPPELQPLNTDDPQFSYLLQEVSIFNNRVVWYLEQQQKQEIFGLGASGALWAYILQLKNHDFLLPLILLPIFITVVLAVKSSVLTRSMQESMSYLATLEERFKLEDNMGWVHFYRSNTSHYKKRWRTVFWISLLVINAMFSVYFFVNRPAIVPAQNQPTVKCVIVKTIATQTNPSIKKEKKECPNKTQ